VCRGEQAPWTGLRANPRDTGAGGGEGAPEGGRGAAEKIAIYTRILRIRKNFESTQEPRLLLDDDRILRKQQRHLSHTMAGAISRRQI
jgi:hypothetical protein